MESMLVVDPASAASDYESAPDAAMEAGEAEQASFESDYESVADSGEEVMQACMDMPPLWEDCDEVPRVCFGMPPLQSDLGMWAQWVVNAEAWQTEALGVPVKYTYDEEDGE